METTTQVKFNDTKTTRYYKVSLTAFYPVVYDWEWGMNSKSGKKMRFVSVWVDGILCMFGETHIAEYRQVPKK